VGVAVAEFAGEQYGVVARRQLNDLGLRSDAIARRAAGGMLHPLHGGRVYSVGLASLTKRGVYLAATLAGGPDAWLSHRSAGDLWGLRPSSAVVEITVCQAAAPIPGVRVHRSRMLDPVDFTVREGIPVTSVARTLLDLASVLRPADLIVAIDRAERLNLFDLTAVVDVLSRARGRKGARALRRAIAAYKPSTQKSELERRLKRLLEKRPDLPGPSFNVLVDGEAATHEVDAFWPDERLVVQVDGFEFHRTRRDRERDAASDADLELAGFRVMRLTWDDVNEHGDRTLRRVALAGGWPAARTAA
jgi:very-short-patch-repair endonuclease